MLYGLNTHDIKIAAIPGVTAICPFCKNPLISKCGHINIWHWAHKSNFECDSWKNRETDWHLSWKAKFPKSCTEVTIKNKYFPYNSHRADVLLESGIVIEFQNSPLSVNDINERENFYQKMIWVINSEGFDDNIIFRYSKNSLEEAVTYFWCEETKCMYSTKTKKTKELLACIGVPISSIKEDILRQFKYIPFRWKYYRKSWHFAKMPVMVDLKTGILLWIKKIYPSGVGYGKIIRYDSLLKWAVIFKN